MDQGEKKKRKNELPKEQQLVEDFQKKIDKEEMKTDILTSTNNRRQHMDIQWKENFEIIGLEAKVFGDSRNNSTHFWQLFGQLLHGKKLIGSQNYITGFLFRNQDREWINKKMKDSYFENDVIGFSKIANLDRIYFYDDIEKEYVELSIRKWLEEIY